MPATVTLPLEEYDAVRVENRRMADEIQALKTQLTEAKLDNGDPISTRAMATMTRASLSVVSFAVANLSPEIIKRWPFEALRTIADNMKHMPDGTLHDVEYARELTKFAAECESWESKRKRDGDVYVPPPTPEMPSLDELMKQTPPESQT